MNTQNDIYAEGLNIQKELGTISKFYISPKHTAEQIAKLLFLHKYARINNKGIKRIENALDRFAKNNKDVALELAKQLAAHPDGENLKTLADSFNINVSDLPEEKEEVPVEEAIEAIKVSAKEEETTVEQWYNTTCEKLDPNKRVVSNYCNNNEVKPAGLFEVTKESIEEAIAEPENNENISLAEMLEAAEKPGKKRFMVDEKVMYKGEFKEYIRANNPRLKFAVYYGEFVSWFHAYKLTTNSHVNQDTKNSIIAYEADIRGLYKIKALYSKTRNLTGAFYSDMMNEIDLQILHCKDCIENLKKLTT